MHRAVALEFQIDPARVAGNHLIHRIVKRFGREVMQCRLVGASDVHPGAPANRLQTFKDFNVFGRIALGLARFAGGGTGHGTITR